MVGFLFVVLAFLAAFTIYGEVSGVIGVACAAGGIIVLGRERG